MANKVPAKKPQISKPDILKSAEELGDMQMASLYSLSRNYVKNNTDFINKVINITQNVIAQNDASIASSTPQMLVDTVQTAVYDKKKQSSKNADTPQILTDIQGLTETSKDMDLFRELFPIATPMFELFYEYDMVYEMIPEASKCFDILKDAVLSSDNFSKKYLIPRYDDFKIDSSTSGINASAQQHAKLIQDIIDEYDCNDMFDTYINDAMKYGAKPVMIIPIDHNFRRSAEKLLKTESADDVRKLIRDQYNDGAEVKMESNIEGFTESKTTNESGEKEYTFDSFESNGFTLEMNKDLDDLIAVYEDSLEAEIASVSTANMTQKEKTDFDIACENKRATLKRAKDPKNRKVVLEEMLKAVDKMVNTKVKFSYGTEAMVMKDASKICGQIKTMRRVKNRTSKNTDTNAMTMESVYTSDPNTLDKDVEAVCEAMSGVRYKKVTKKVKKYKTVTGEDGKTKREPYETEVESFQLITDDSVALEDFFDERWDLEQELALEAADSDNRKVKDVTVKGPRRETTGSVIIPLMPDTVVPISVHGQHIGYYVIERTGTDDLGSGVASLLGYRNGGLSSGFGLGASNLYGANSTMATSDGAGVLIRDMVDIPMYVKDDARRVDILRSMLARAISERLKNPDIVDDKAFNSIIYSLIKDNYITKREVKITYVPAHSMVYFAHEINKDTGIGISVMQKGLFFAHVYIASLITNLMIAIAKSADREQVNVEVGMSNRIEATVQKVMRSLQTKRASIDSIGNIDTIMKSLGTFTRTISLRHNGNPLIELETIPGQQVDMDNSLMEKALKSFVNSLYVPHSAVNFLDDTEYARSISLQNALFMSKIVSFQARYQQCASKFVRILIRNKYPEKILTKENAQRIRENKGKMSETTAGVTSSQDLIDLTKVFTDLPSPEGLNIASLNEQISNVSTFSDSMVDTLVPSEWALDEAKSELLDQLKAIIKNGLYKKYLPGLPWDEFDNIVESAKTQIVQAKLKIEHPEDDNSSDSSDSGSSNFSGF